MQLVNIIDNHKLCKGCGGTENYRWLNNDLKLYRTKNGEDAVFVENEKLRLTSCQLLLPKEDSMCIACKKSHHYLRILTSRRKAKRTMQHPEKG